MENNNMYFHDIIGKKYTFSDLSGNIMDQILIDLSSCFYICKYNSKLFACTVNCNCVYICELREHLNSMKDRYIWVNTKRLKYINIIKENMKNFICNMTDIVYDPFQFRIPNKLNLCNRYKAQILKNIDYEYVNPILNFIKDVICNNNNSTYNRLLDWLSNTLLTGYTDSILVLYSPKCNIGRRSLIRFIDAKILQSGGLSEVVDKKDLDRLIKRNNHSLIIRVRESLYSKGLFKHITSVFKKENIPPWEKNRNFIIITDNIKTIQEIKCSNINHVICEGSYKMIHNHIYFENLLKYIEGTLCDISANNFLTFLLQRDTKLDNIIVPKPQIITSSMSQSSPEKKYTNMLLLGNIGRSAGERCIYTILKTLNIKFEMEKTFPGCKYKNLLRFDFYLPLLNTCIEYDGKQHEFPVDIWGGEEGLTLTKIRDNIKNQYCKNNGIKLFRINYKTKLVEMHEIIKKIILAK